MVSALGACIRFRPECTSGGLSDEARGGTSIGNGESSIGNGGGVARVVRWAVVGVTLDAPSRSRLAHPGQVRRGVNRQS